MYKIVAIHEDDGFAYLKDILIGAIVKPSRKLHCSIKESPWLAGCLEVMKAPQNSDIQPGEVIYFLAVQIEEFRF